MARKKHNISSSSNRSLLHPDQMEKEPTKSGEIKEAWVTEKVSTSGPSGQGVPAGTSQKGDMAAALVFRDWPELNTAAFKPIIMRFFESLTEQQWGDISAGFSDEEVMRQLSLMCMKVLKLVSKAITEVLFPAIHRFAKTYGTFTPRSIEQVGQQLFSEPLKEYFGITENDIQSSLGNVFSQALCDVVGVDNADGIPPMFMAAIVGEVVKNVNSFLSVAIQTSLDEGPLHVTVASRQISSSQAAKDMLEGVVSTIHSFLKGKVSASLEGTKTVRKGKLSDPDSDSKDESLLHKHTPPLSKKLLSMWKTCFCKRQRVQVSPAAENEALAQPTDIRSGRNVSGSAISDDSEPASPSPRQMSLTRMCSSDKIEAVVKPDLRVTLLEILDSLEDQDVSSEDTRKVASHPSSTTSAPKADLGVTVDMNAEDIHDFLQSPHQSDVEKQADITKGCASGNSRQKPDLPSSCNDDVNQAKKTKSSFKFLKYCKKDQKKKEEAPAEDQALPGDQASSSRSRKPSVWPRINLFLLGLCCITE